MKKIHKKIIGSAAGASVSFPGQLIETLCENLKIDYPKYLYNLDLSMNVGLKVTIHEYGHVAAVKLVYKPYYIFVHVSGLEHLKNGRLYEWITGKDFCGYTSIGFKPVYTQDHLVHYDVETTPLGDMLGYCNSIALVSTAGTFAEMGAYTAMYLLGRKAGDERPTLSTGLKAYAFSWYVGRTNYLLSAALMNEGELWEAGMGGHDWAKFSIMTKIDPKITLAAYLLFFPSLMVGLHLKDRYYDKKRDRREALRRLTEASDVPKNELEKFFESYITTSNFRFLKKYRLGRRTKKLEKFKINKLGDYETELFRLDGVLSCEKNNFKRIRLKSKRHKIEKEYDRFKDYVISDKTVNVTVETERKLYEQLCKKISEFNKDPKKTAEYFCKKYSIDSKHSDELIKRLNDFYEDETPSATEVFKFD